MNIIGTFDVLRLDSFPADLRVYVAIWVRFEPDETGDHQLELRFVTEDGAAASLGTWTTIVDPDLGHESPSSRKVVPVHLPLQKAGRFSFQLWHNGQILAHAPACFLGAQ
jgi:hypothetical protein